MGFWFLLRISIRMYVCILNEENKTQQNLTIILNHEVKLHWLLMNRFKSWYYGPASQILAPGFNAWIRKYYWLLLRGGIVRSIPCNYNHLLIYCAPHLSSLILHGTNDFASPKKEVVLRILIPLESPLSSAGFEPMNVGSNGKHDNHYTTENDLI
jgi:hypothetical protein